MGLVAAVTTLPVAEVFGPTWQGEGPYAGVRTGFVRLGRCNLSCSWCDTPYTWDASRYDVAKEAPDTPLDEVHAALVRQDVDTVCLSGGEPLLHHQRLAGLLSPLWQWHVETNGTIAPPSYWRDLVAHTSVSPKVTTGDPAKKRLKWPVLEQWNTLANEGLAAFKFVARVPADLDLVAQVVDRVGIDRRHVWVMPEGTVAPQLLARHRRLAGPIEDRGWNTTTRLHSLLWGQERGR